MQIISDIDEMRRWCRAQSNASRRIGLVPTMGALHEGHLSLVRRSRSQCELCVTTIFVNPTQFAPTEDLNRYPRPIDRDLQLLRDEGVAAVFLPTDQTMYPPGFGTYVLPPPVAAPLEGVSRPEHFRGVTTVVLKLMQIVPADCAFFGEKDYQQLRVITQMVHDLNVPVEIVPCPIVRDPDGLAMSSRNRYLSPEERRRALSLSQALDRAERMFRDGNHSPREIESTMSETLACCDAVEYAVLADAITLAPLHPPEQSTDRSTEKTADGKADRAIVALIAARVGATRLIDNRIFQPT